MTYNNTDLDNWGKPKLSAWKWAAKEYGLVSIVWLVLFIAACCDPFCSPWMIAGFLLLSGFPIMLCTYVPKWYRELVEGNQIQPFSKSSFKDIFKKGI